MARVACPLPGCLVELWVIIKQWMAGGGVGGGERSVWSTGDGGRAESSLSNWTATELGMNLGGLDLEEYRDRWKSAVSLSVFWEWYIYTKVSLKLKYLRLHKGKNFVVKIYPILFKCLYCSIKSLRLTQKIIVFKPKAIPERYNRV